MIPRLLTIGLLFPALGSAQAPDLTITLHAGTDREAQAKAQLERVLGEFKVGPWLFTHDVVIDEDVIPHSHPVLTLNAHSLENDTVQLGNLLHEEFHWLEEARPEPRAQAIAVFRSLFPTPPAGGSEGGA